MPKKHFQTWLAVLPAMAVPFIGSLFYFVILSKHDAAKIIYAATKLFTVLWPLIAVCALTRTGLPRIDRDFKKHLKALPLGVLVGAMIVLLMFGLMETRLGATIAGGSKNIEAKARELGFLEHFWLSGFFLSVVHSFIEEYYWRWFVFGRLRSLTPVRAAHILAGVSFAAHHVVVVTQFFSIFWGLVSGVCVALGGIVWSAMYDKQETLVGAWASHMIVDSGIMAIGHRLLFGA